MSPKDIRPNAARTGGGFYPRVSGDRAAFHLWGQGSISPVAIGKSYEATKFKSHENDPLQTSQLEPI